MALSKPADKSRFWAKIISHCNSKKQLFYTKIVNPVKQVFKLSGFHILTIKTTLVLCSTVEYQPTGHAIFTIGIVYYENMVWSKCNYLHHRQFRYTAYRQVVRWAYGILGRNIRKAIPSCVVSAIRRQFAEEGQTYKGFQWPHLEDD